MSQTQISPLKVSQFLFNDIRMSRVWLLVRLYLGYTWLMAGWEKVHNPVWVGSSAGTAIKGFLNGALAKTAGAHPDVSSWYAYFISHVALPHATTFSYLVAFGELLVGVGLIVGAVVGICAFFGLFMNLNYLLAGTVSINPTMLVISVLLILAWRTAGYYGVDYFLFRKIMKNPYRADSAGVNHEKEIR